MTPRLAIPAVLALTAIAGCGSSNDTAEPARPAASVGSLPQGSERVAMNPAKFTTKIDNPYWPMTPGNRWVMRETDGQGGVQRVEITVTDKTRKIANGVVARVVRDTVTEKGALVEDTFDWYAQDERGNLWYLGEDTTEYENGKPHSTKGSWEAGVDGAQAGIALPADPEVGLTYRQEYYRGEAEDAARVLSLDERASVPFGDFQDVLMTRDYTPLTPDLVEHKFYARGVGPILALTIAGGSDREELVSFKRG